MCGCACSGKTDTGGTASDENTAQTPTDGPSSTGKSPSELEQVDRESTSADADLLWSAIDSGELDPTGFGDTNDADNGLFEDEVLARARFELTPISVTGSVVSIDGSPLPQAKVELNGSSSSVDDDGTFVVAGVPRHNSELTLSAPGFKPTIVFVHLQKPIQEESVAVGSIALSPDGPDVVRFLFGGDTAFGRRFLDPAERAGPLELPVANPEALIDADAPAEGTRAALRHLQTLFLSADYPVVNLESPVTASPSEYHSQKQYTFYTLPDSLAVFPWLGVSYVSLGNNHVYDYLEDGLLDTLAALDEHGVAASGAGPDPESAFSPHRELLGGTTYSLLSMTSVSGSQNPPLYVATDDPTKGGAADLRDDERVGAAVSAEVDLGHVAIAQLHTGKEYSFWPTDFAREGMSLCVQSGASLVIGHHPHVAQGFAHEDGTLIVSSLGNLCFDQARLETMLGLLAEVDMRGSDVVATRGLPIYLEDYTPRPITGELAAHLIRRIGEVSENTSVLVEASAGRVLPTAVALSTTEDHETVSVDIGPGGAIVDLRPLRRPEQSLIFAQVSASNSAISAGQDILLHGDFEDWDVDEERFELSRWDVTGQSSFPCLSGTHRGAVSLCSVRTSENRSTSVVAFRNRIRVLGEEVDAPNKDLSLVGYAKGDNAGEMWLETELYASVGSREFGRKEVWQHAGGDFDWTFFSANLELPVDEPGTDPLTDNPHALRFFYFHEPPSDGQGIVRLDDLAIVSWRPSVTASDGLTLTSPNPIDFLRISGPEGKVELQLTFHADLLTADNR